MRESTRKGLSFVVGCLEAAGKKLTDAAFVYHSERTWVGLTTEGDVVTVTIAKKDTEPPDIKMFRAESGETFNPAAAGKKKGKKTDGS